VRRGIAWSSSSCRSKLRPARREGSSAPSVAELIGEKGIEIDRRKIDLAEPIKEVGEHSVPIRLHREVIANVKLKVTAAE